jgi:hypothetical protein
LRVNGIAGGFDSQAGGGQAAIDQVGPVLDLLQLALDDPDQAVKVSGGEGYRARPWRSSAVRSPPSTPSPGTSRPLGGRLDLVDHTLTVTTTEAT